MNKFILLLLCPFMLLNISGCWFIVGGAVGVAGAYVVSKDTIQGETELPYENLWNAATSVSRIRGVVKQEESVSGYIEVEANSSLVKISLLRLTPTTTRLKVSARTKIMRFANLSLAQDFYVKIMEEAK